METLFRGLALCCLFCSTVRRALDCVKVFPISIVELSHGCVSDCGSDSVGGEEYSVNVCEIIVIVSEHCRYRSGIICNGRSVIDPAYLAYQFPCHSALDQMSLAGDGIPVPRKLSIPRRRSGTNRRVFGKDLFMNL